MIEKKISFKDESWESILRGVEKLQEAVGSTLGPNGKTVIIEDQFGQPHVTKDGITVAEYITLTDPQEHLAMMVVRQASKKTALRAGDGTTSSVVLAHAILNNASKYKIKSINNFKKGMNACKEHIVTFLKNLSKELGPDDLANVATISANNDRELGKLISDAFKKVGKDGVVTVEESYNEDSYINVKEGTKIDRGWASHHLVTNVNRREFVASNAMVLISGSEIQSAQQILPVLEFCAKNNKTILIVSECSEEFVATMILNNTKGRFKACVVRPPGIGYKRDELLEDLSYMTGAIMFDEGQGQDFGVITPDWLGEVSKIIVSEGETILYTDPDHERQETIENLKSHINAMLEDEKNESDAWHYRDRLSKLTGGVASIHVGASTEVEMKEKKDRVDDAISATRAAMKMGVLPGGGSALSHSGFVVMGLSQKDNEGMDFKLGWNALEDSLDSIMIKIMQNAGKTDDEIGELSEQIFNDKDGVLGFNAMSDKIENLFESGVLDPTAVVLSVLDNAVSVSCELLSTNCIITNVRA